MVAATVPTPRLPTTTLRAGDADSSSGKTGGHMKHAGNKQAGKHETGKGPAVGQSSWHRILTV